MPRTSTTLATLAAALALGLLACDVARPVSRASAGASACVSCHGDASRSEAVALVQAAPDTGAHLAHLRAGTFRGAVACAQCHEVPASASHPDGEVQLPFPSLARADGAAPAWNAGAGTCSGVYCHGATRGGGPAATPAWTSGARLDCSSCHGYPPPSHASTSTRCAACHPGTVSAAGALLLANGLHVNGEVEVAAAHAADWEVPSNHGRAANRDLASCRTCHGDDYAGGTSGVSCNDCHQGTAWQTSCTFCHGDASRTANRAAPPVGTQGEIATTERAVGAHAAHLSGGAIGPAVACAECHAVPTTLAHVNGTAAIAFGAAARRGGAQPTWNGTTCSGTYCHGATRTAAGGANKTPAWTGGAAEAACGTCHGAPPPGHSPASCGGCHGGYSATTVNAATHLNGAVERVSCTSCHGNPPSTGDHGAHSRYACSDCHVHSGSGATHADGVKNVQYSDATYNPSTRSCGTFSCHGESHSGRTW